MHPQHWVTTSNTLDWGGGHRCRRYLIAGLSTVLRISPARGWHSVDVTSRVALCLAHTTWGGRNMGKERTALANIELSSTRAMTKENRQRCAQLVALIRRKMQDIRDGFFEIGTALADINNNALFKAAGYESLEALLEQEGFMGAAQARKLITISEHVDREDAIALGTEKAYALTRYSQALGNGGPVASLLKRNELVNGKRLKEASVRDLVQATREAHGPARDGVAHQRARTAREAQAAVPEDGAEK